MSWQRVRLIARRAVLDLFRDRKTVWLLLFVPLIGVLIGFLGRDEIADQADAAGTLPRTVFVHDINTIPLELRQELGNGNLSLTEVDDVVQQVKDQRSGVAMLVTAGDPLGVELIVGEGSLRARLLQARVTAVLERYADGLVEQRLRDAGLPSSAAHPVTVSVRTATGDDSGTSIIASLLPLLLVIQVVQLGPSPVVDGLVTARERRTLEALLAAPVRRSELLLGVGLVGFFVGALAATVTGVLGVLSVSVASGQAISLPPVLIGGLALEAVLMSATAISLTLVAAAVARTAQQANLFLLPITLGTILPLSFLSSRGPEGIPEVLYALPGLGSALIASFLIDDQVPVYAWPLSIIGTLAFVAICLPIGARLFRGERVVTRI